jgi:hypothetical protein
LKIYESQQETDEEKRMILLIAKWSKFDEMNEKLKETEKNLESKNTEVDLLKQAICWIGQQLEKEKSSKK